ncbi:MAG: PAS domain-containing protein, partial [Chitinophagaceae bacterium]
MNSPKNQLPPFLTGGGQMAEMINAMDWTNHPPGDIGQWSHSLRAALGICLNSFFPMSVMWGDDLIMFYNDAYSELIGEKHLMAPGAKASRVWSEAWPQMGITIEGVLQNGTARWCEDQLLIIDRNGVPENCFFTSSYSAIRDDNGEIAGVFWAINDTSKRVRAMAHQHTEQVLASRKIEESEERFRNLVYKASSPICILKGEDMRLEVANDPLYAVWGVDKSALGKTFLEIIPEMKDQPFMGWLLEVYNSGITHYGNEQAAYFERSNGERETAYFNFVYQPYRENNGMISGVIVFATDVTELVVARKKMEQQATMVTGLLMTAPAFVCTLKGKDHVYDLINERYQKIFGNRILKNRPILEALPELDGQGIIAKLDHVFTTGETYVGIDNPVTLSRDEGLAPELCYFNFSYQPMYNEEGEIYSILVFGYEVTDKAMFNQKMKESESHFRQMADLMPSKITSATPDGGVTYYNKEWLDYSDMSFDELKSFGYHKLMHPDEVPVFQKLLAEAANDGKTLEMEMRFINRQGEYIWHLNRASPIKDKDGHIKMWLGVTSNIQHQKSQEEALEKAVINRTIKLEEANEKLLFENEEKGKRAAELVVVNRDLQAFTFISSHHLQEPLRKIQTYASLILEREPQLSEEGKYHFQRIQSSASRMQHLIKDLLSYSNTHVTDRTFENVDLNAIVDAIKNDLAETILEKNAVIETSSLC